MKMIERAAEIAGAWAAVSPKTRAEVITGVADALDAAGTSLIEIADAETKLGTKRLTGELARTTFQMRLLAAESGSYYDVRIDRADPSWPPGPRPELRRYRTAVGPVLVFAASNFPFAFSVAGGDTASAWVAGCSVVVKAHPGHPELSRRTASIIEDALGRWGALLGLIEGEAAGVEALRHPAIAAAAFTGSVAGGLALARIAAERPVPIPFHGELGSVNPVIVLPGAARTRADELAAGYAGSLTMGNGQFCTNPGLVFAPSSSPFVDLVAERLRGIPATPFLNDRIASGFHTGAERLTAIPGVREVVSGAGARLLEIDLADFVPDVAEECFGPLGVIVRYSRLSDVLPVLAALPGQLTTTVHAQPEEASDVEALRPVLAGRSGRILWGGWPTGVAVTAAMQHGGPFPATTSPASTSVGTAAVERFLRPVSYQDWPSQLLPEPLRDDNPWNVPQGFS
ncbi:aldehyde dehydrogenase (NADP(+)) [Amycolatopsis decaplanina]|uniref:NAD-dependent aldehyde dehydrogenase n=1 Tax=Amycolatopsis decaplanina DSM 44594 TaxID=1284240 RepID=M2YN88_9PSEU|nr:aldehyde dehydrogenase (NADP(+)) [Amycolatopsis decaplanina]EME63370.1 NAD-dependent aldehyde dehydrogenase [Amycolatopsis decaplanina DSM 44594]